MKYLGKWSERGFPHKGWVYEDVEDLGSIDGSCEFCGTEIRYVHYLSHARVNEFVGVGCVCAGELTGDYATPKDREKRMKSVAARNARWLKKQWTPSRKGFTLRALGYQMTVFRIDKPPHQGSWGYFVGDVRGKTPCKTLEGAKLACRELIEVFKNSEINL